MSDAAAQTSLSPKLRELIALTVGQANNCHYCLSAHTAIAQHEKIGDQEILLARKGESHDAKTQAVLAFAKHVIEKKGHVTDQEVNALKKAGVNDTEIAEIILVISLNLFTNYFNHITDPKIDFPLAPNLTKENNIMKAIGIKEFGGIDKMDIMEIPKPETCTQ